MSAKGRLRTRISKLSGLDREGVAGVWRLDYVPIYTIEDRAAKITYCLVKPPLSPTTEYRPSRKHQPRCLRIRDPVPRGRAKTYPDW